MSPAARRRSRARLVAAGLAAVAMTAATLAWNRYSPIVTSDLPWTQAVLTLDAEVAHSQGTPFAFVDVSGAQEVWSGSAQGGQITRTDRRRLLEFAQVLAEAPGAPRFVVLDILFDTPSAQDSALTAELRPFDGRVLVPSLPRADGSFADPLLDVDHAPALAQSAGGLTLRTPVRTASGAPTLPLRVADALHPHRRPSLSIPLGAVYFRPLVAAPEGTPTPFHIPLVGGGRGGALLVRRETPSIPLGLVVDLARAQSTPDERRRLVETLFGGKVVVVGHMVGQDQHDTVAGAVPGGVILASAYVALADGQDFAHGSVLLVLFLGFLAALLPLAVPPGGALAQRLRPRPAPPSRLGRAAWRAARWTVGRASAARVFLTLLALHLVLFVAYRALVPVLFWTGVLVGGPAAWSWGRPRYRWWRRRIPRTATDSAREYSHDSRPDEEDGAGSAVSEDSPSSADPGPTDTPFAA